MTSLIRIPLLLAATLAVIFLSSSALGASVLDAPQTYSNHKVLTVTLPSKESAELLHELGSRVNIDEWRSPRPTSLAKMAEYSTDIMISSEDFPFVRAFLTAHRLKFTIMIEDVGSLIETQKLESLARRAKRKASTHAYVDWEDYYRYDEIAAWVNEIVANNSDIASVSVIGKSTEGRNLQLVKISKPGSPANKNAVLIDGGFHAREWISPAIVTYILNEFLGPNRKSNEEILDLIDLYIVPIVNVDGYEYSHSSSRLWRKTRSNHGSNLGCRGVDPNRNFDFHFGGSGTSNDKCSEIYRGPNAYSEPETAALRDVLTNKSINFKSYLTIHSYGQWWLTPWSWTYDLPEDYDDLLRFGEHGYSALRAVHGTSFLVGATTEILGTTAGCSDDWAKAVAGIKYANTLEVRDTGRYGFVLPANQIIPTSEETWAGIRAVLRYDFENDRPRSL